MVTSLGDKVKDSVTCFEGVVVSRAEYLNGCVRCSVQPLEMKDGIPQKWQHFDEPQLEILVKNHVKVNGQLLTEPTNDKTGGPRPDQPQNREQ